MVLWLINSYPRSTSMLVVWFRWLALTSGSSVARIRQFSVHICHINAPQEVQKFKNIIIYSYYFYHRHSQLLPNTSHATMQQLLESHIQIHEVKHTIVIHLLHSASRLPWGSCGKTNITIKCNCKDDFLIKYQSRVYCYLNLRTTSWIKRR